MIADQELADQKERIMTKLDEVQRDSECQIACLKIMQQALMTISRTMDASGIIAQNALMRVADMMEARMRK